MKHNQIQEEIKNYKVRQGFLYKRSRFMKEWRKRWIVVTINYIFTFENQQCEKVTQTIDLNDVFSITSQLKKVDELISCSFFVNTKYHDFAFCTADVSEKWSWIVSMERIMNFREKGTSTYNSIDQINSMGFESYQQFQFRQSTHFDNHKHYSTLSLEQEERQKFIHADEVLKKLVEEQQIINKRQEQLKVRQLELEKQLVHDHAFNIKIQNFNKHIQKLQQNIANIRKQKNQYKKAHIFLYETVEKAICKWSKLNNKQQYEQLLLSTIELLNVIHQNTPTVPNKQKSIDNIRTMRQASNSQSYKKKCGQLINKLQKQSSTFCENSLI